MRIAARRRGTASRHRLGAKLARRPVGGILRPVRGHIIVTIDGIAARVANHFDAIQSRHADVGHTMSNDSRVEQVARLRPSSAISTS